LRDGAVWDNAAWIEHPGANHGRRTPGWHLRAAVNRRATLLVAAASVSVPMALGMAVGWLSAPVLAPQIDPLTYSLLVGVALAITAVPILGRIMRECGLTRTPAGVVAISAAAINDVVGWVLLAGVSAYAARHFSADGMILQLGGLAAPGAVLWFVPRPAVDGLLARVSITAGKVPADPEAAAAACRPRHARGRGGMRAITCR